MIMDNDNDNDNDIDIDIDIDINKIKGIKCKNNLVCGFVLPSKNNAYKFCYLCNDCHNEFGDGFF